MLTTYCFARHEVESEPTEGKNYKAEQAAKKEAAKKASWRCTVCQKKLALKTIIAGTIQRKDAKQKKNQVKPTWCHLNCFKVPDVLQHMPLHVIRGVSALTAEEQALVANKLKAAAEGSEAAAPQEEDASETESEEEEADDVAEQDSEEDEKEDVSVLLKELMGRTTSKPVTKTKAVATKPRPSKGTGTNANALHAKAPKESKIAPSGQGKARLRSLQRFEAKKAKKQSEFKGLDNIDAARKRLAKRQAAESDVKPAEEKRKKVKIAEGSPSSSAAKRPDQAAKQHAKLEKEVKLEASLPKEDPMKTSRGKKRQSVGAKKPLDEVAKAMAFSKKILKQKEKSAAKAEEKKEST